MFVCLFEGLCVFVCVCVSLCVLSVSFLVRVFVCLFLGVIVCLFVLCVRLLGYLPAGVRAGGCGWLYVCLCVCVCVCLLVWLAGCVCLCVVGFCWRVSLFGRCPCASSCVCLRLRDGVFACAYVRILCVCGLLYLRIVCSLT